MADVIGPNSFLPGQVLSTTATAMCDDHPDRPAYKRIVGETDSFGSELIDLCQECYTAHINHVPEPICGTCAWCKKHSDNLKPTRDFEEGLHGPVYDVCSGCRQRQNELAAEELAHYSGHDDEDDDRDFHDDGPPDDDDFLDLAPSNASAVETVSWQEESRDYVPPRITVRSPKTVAAEVAALKEKMTIKADPSLPVDGVPNVWPFPIRTK